MLTDVVDATSSSRRGPLRRRFMRSMSIGVKLWTTTGILALPLIGLGVFYVQSLTSTLGFSSKELEGVALYRPLQDLTGDVDRHSERYADYLGGDKAVAQEASALKTRVDAALSRFDQLNSAQGNAETRRQALELHQKWAALNASAPANLSASLAAHAAVLDAVDAIRNQIATDWLLILDPELTSYSLLDATLNKLPDTARSLSEVRTHLWMLRTGSADPGQSVVRAISLITMVRDRALAAREELKSTGDPASQDAGTLRTFKALDLEHYVGILRWCDVADAAFSHGQPDARTLDSLLATERAESDSAHASNIEVLTAAGMALQIRHDHQYRNATSALGGSAVAMTLAILFMLALSGRVSGAVKRLLFISERIAEGHFDTAIDPSGTDELSRLFAGIDNLQKRLEAQIVSERAAAAETARVKQALDFASTNLMVTDENHAIIYLNQAMLSLLRGCEADLRREQPHFAQDKVLGSSMESFYPNPSHQRDILERLTTTHTADFRIAGREVRLAVTPVFDQSGRRIGGVTEWVDRTQEVNTEQELTSLVGRAIDGDLTCRIDARSKTGFYASLATNLNQLLDNMSAILLKVSHAAHEIDHGADEIAQGNGDLSQRTEQQASSLEQTAASMDQMTSSVGQNAVNAGQANQLAGAAQQQAIDGGKVAEDAVRAMSLIRESSSRIGAIINVIDEIAFQTNLLALNEIGRAHV